MTRDKNNRKSTVAKRNRVEDAVRECARREAMRRHPSSGMDAIARKPLVVSGGVRS